MNTGVKLSLPWVAFPPLVALTATAIYLAGGWGAVLAIPAWIAWIAWCAWAETETAEEERKAGLYWTGGQHVKLSSTRHTMSDADA